MRKTVGQGVQIEAEYLSLRALATYSGLSVRTLREYLLNPVHPLPHLKLPGKILVKRTDFDVWIEQFRVAATESLSDVVEHVVQSLR
jgi:hypothetical protein